MNIKKKEENGGEKEKWENLDEKNNIKMWIF